MGRFAHIAAAFLIALTTGVAHAEHASSRGATAEYKPSTELKKGVKEFSDGIIKGYQTQQKSFTDFAQTSLKGTLDIVAKTPASVPETGIASFLKGYSENNIPKIADDAGLVSPAHNDLLADVNGQLNYAQQLADLVAAGTKGPTPPNTQTPIPDAPPVRAAIEKFAERNPTDARAERQKIYERFNGSGAAGRINDGSSALAKSFSNQFVGGGRVPGTGAYNPPPVARGAKP